MQQAAIAQNNNNKPDRTAIFVIRLNISHIFAQFHPHAPNPNYL